MTKPTVNHLKHLYVSQKCWVGELIVTRMDLSTGKIHVDKSLYLELRRLERISDRYKDEFILSLWKEFAPDKEPLK